MGLDDSDRTVDTRVSRRAVLGTLLASATPALGGCSSVRSLLSEDASDRTATTAESAGPAVPEDGADRPEGQLWPVDSDATDGVCESGDGETKSATGEGAAYWFEYGGCGQRKTYRAIPGATYWILSRTDGAMLTDAAYEIRERVDDSWETRKTVSGPEGDHNERMTKFTPETDRFRIVNEGRGFYVEVYGPLPQ